MACNSTFDQAVIILSADGEPAMSDGNFVFALPGEFEAVNL